VKIVLDTSILVRANEHSHGLARDLLIKIIEGRHTLLISNEMLHELSRVLRYPRLQAVYHLSEDLVYGYIAFLRLNSMNVELDALIPAPIRDVNDIIVMQTAIIGEANILCASDDDFFARPAREYLEEMGIIVVDDMTLMRRLRT
jgi:putative PIN family toxin of toxin-antitoxin system